MKPSNDLENRAINTIRFLSADGVQQAKSGHPGLPMGAAAMAYTIWTRHLRFNPTNPKWPDRDRFILSGGHGSMLLYSMLHLTGFDLPLDELKRFRQWGSKAPGHPEYGLTAGVETTTGPLGQGFGNGVGMAIAAAHLAGLYNRPDHTVVDHYIYAIVTDGDLMEGVASEAASLAGHLRLGRLIYLYDDNRISIDGSTDLSFTEDRAARFAAYGWQVLRVGDGNNVDEIDQAIQQAKQDPRPSLIVCRTQIGFGLPTRQGTEKAHGEPPGDEELNGAKKNLGWPLEPRFYIPEDVLAFYRSFVNKGADLERRWCDRLDAYRSVYPELAGELERRLDGRLPDHWMDGLPVYPADPKGIATRIASGKALNALAAKIPELIGGSADLAPSNKTWIDGASSFQADQPQGRNFHFGVREHGMGAVVNGMNLHGGVIAYGGTFLVFSDYMRPAIRISALSEYPSIWVFTHDSVGVGEDGPTHQPVEHLSALRAIPGLVVLRPADANETVQAWRYAIANRHSPTVLIFTRQNLPTLDREKYADASGVERGAYVLYDSPGGDPEIIFMATGSEVSVIVEAAHRIEADGYRVRIVSFPSWELFEKQSVEYQEAVFPRQIRTRLAVETGISQGWHRWVGDSGRIISIDRYGASAPYQVILEKLGFSSEAIYQAASEIIPTRKG